MKDIHETQSMNQQNINVKKDEVYTPIPELQKIEAGGVFKKNSYNVSKFPKGIRLIGYFLFGGLFIIFLLGIIFSIIFNLF